MKRIFTLLGIAAVLVGCQKDVELKTSARPEGDFSIRAAVPVSGSRAMVDGDWTISEIGGAESRTSLDGLAVKWDEGDKVGLSTITGGELSGNVMFTYDHTDYRQDVFVGQEIPAGTYRGYYPYNADLNVVDNVTFSFPKEQVQTANGDYSNIDRYDFMYSDPVTFADTTKIGYVTFHHAFAIVKFVITDNNYGGDDKLTSISLVDTEHESFYNSAVLSAEGEPVLMGSTDEVTLQAGSDGFGFAANGTYVGYLVVPNDEARMLGKLQLVLSFDNRPDMTMSISRPAEGYFKAGQLYTVTRTIEVGNLIYNGSLEIWSASKGLPDGWAYTSNNAEGTAALALEKVITGAQSGNFAVTLASTASAQKNFTQTVAVKPGKMYWLSFWYKDNDAPYSNSGTRFACYFKNAAGVNSTMPVIVIDGSESGNKLGINPTEVLDRKDVWTECWVAVACPSDAAFLDFTIRTTGTNRAMIDNIEMESADIDDPQVMTAGATGVTHNVATLNGSYTPGDLPITGIGFEYKKSTDANYTSVSAEDLDGDGVYSLEVEVDYSTDYTYRAYVLTGYGKTYSDIDRTFTTAALPAGIYFEAPEISGTFKAGVASTDGKITIPYVNAVGNESYTIGVTSTDASFTALSGVAKAVSAAGSGNLEIDLGSWTPTAAGYVTFTISGIPGLTTSTVVAAVQSAGPVTYLSMDFSLATGGAAVFATSGESSQDLFAADFTTNSYGVTAGLTGWTGSKVYTAQGAVKLGTGSAKGWLATPALSTIIGEVDLTVTFKTGARGSDNKAIVVSVSGGGTIDGGASKTISELSNSVMEEKSFTVVGATPATVITFSAVNASNNRYYLDDILIVGQ